MLGFIFALAAGFAAPYLVDPVARPAAKSLRGTIDIEEGELLLLAYMVALFAAAVLAAAFDSGSVIGVTLGGILGYFATQIVAKLREVVEGRPKG